jgi:hypothetical protein
LLSFIKKLLIEELFKADLFINYGLFGMLSDYDDDGIYIIAALLNGFKGGEMICKLFD